MPSVIPYKDGWRAVVRVRDQTATKCFESKREGMAWAYTQEKALRKRVALAKGSLGALLDRYRTEVVELKPYDSKTRIHLKMLAKRFADVQLREMTADWWIDAMKGFKDITPGSRNRYMCQIGSALKVASNLWKIHIDWDAYRQGRAMLKSLSLIGDSAERNRRLRPGELDRIRAEIEKEKHTYYGKVIPMSDIIDFAVIVGYRAAEICRITWDDTDEERKMQWVRDRKHPTKKMGNHYEVALLKDALSIIKRQPRTDSPFIFPFKAGSLGAAFARLCKKAKIKGLRFNDLRREGISRMFEGGFGIPEVAMVSGHRDWKSLKKYTNLKPEGLHNGPLAHR